MLLTEEVYMKTLLSKLSIKNVVKCLGAAVLAICLGFTAGAVFEYGYGKLHGPPPKDYSKDIVLTPQNVVLITGAITPKTALGLEAVRSKVEGMNPAYFVIYSNGGDLAAELEIISFMKSLKTTTVVICVKCMSTAFGIWKAANYSYVMEHSIGMQHNSAGYVYKRNNLNYKSGLEKFYDGVSQRHLELSNMQYFKDLVESEQFMHGKKMVDLGIADAIIHPACEYSLLTDVRRKQYIDNSLGLMYIVGRSNCLIKYDTFLVGIGVYDGMMQGFVDLRQVPNQGPYVYLHAAANMIKESVLQMDFDELEDYNEQ